MTLFIIKYALPALLGYALFVGISGKFNPLLKPVHLEEKPSWMLGLCIGMSVFLVLSIGMLMAYGMTLDAVRTLAFPSFIGIVVVLGGCFLGYIHYRKRVFLEMNEIKVQPQRRAEHANESTDDHKSRNPLIQNDTTARAGHPISSAVALLQNEVKAERDLRQETEQHLRVTRKALSTMHKQERANAAAPESRVSTRGSLELNVTSLKRELVKARQEIRLHVAARAKALGTANKSVAFARQSIELRARLETELETAHHALANRNATIASLISKLEHERRLTDAELAGLANHLAANEPALNTDRSDQTA